MTLEVYSSPLDDTIDSGFPKLSKSRRLEGIAGLVFAVEGKHGLALLEERRTLDAAATKLPMAVSWRREKFLYGGIDRVSISPPLLR